MFSKLTMLHRKTHLGFFVDLAGLSPLAMAGAYMAIAIGEQDLQQFQF